MGERHDLGEIGALKLECSFQIRLHHPSSDVLVQGATPVRTQVHGKDIDDMEVALASLKERMLAAKDEHRP